METEAHHTLEHECRFKAAVNFHIAGDLHKAQTIYEDLLHKDPENALAVHNLGLIALQKGNHENAIRLFEKALELKNDYPEALCNKGVALRNSGKPNEAIKAFEQALAMNPDYSDACFNLASTFYDSGRKERAIKTYKDYLKRTPNNVEARFNLANILYELRDFQGAISQYLKVIHLRPDWAEAYCNLGNAQLANGDVNSAEMSYVRAIEIRPDYVEFYSNHAEALIKQGRIEEALIASKKCIELNPCYVDGYYLLGNLFFKSCRYQEAVDAYTKVVTLNPDHADAYINLGNSYAGLNRFQDAEKIYRKSFEAGLSDPRLYYNLGNILKTLKRNQEAIESYEQAIQLKADFIEPYVNLAKIFEDERELDKAISIQKDALLACQDSIIRNDISLQMFVKYGFWDLAAPLIQKVITARYKNEDLSIFDNTLFILNAMNLPWQVIRDKHNEWGLLQMDHCDKEKIRFSFDKRPAHHALRIGYISPDFCRHSVGWFFREIIKLHDNSAFKIYSYSMSPKEDDVTAEIEHYAFNYQRVHRLESKDIARLVFKDEIDILVDLSGHTKGNRLEIFAYKPAPIQVTAIGYPNGTGLPTVDYRITDAYADLSDSNDHYIENLIRLPGCFLPFINIDVDPIPLSKETFNIPRDAITFVSFNAPYKLNPEVLQLWNKILMAVPRSYLLLSFAGSYIPLIKQNIMKYFNVEKGINERVVFLPFASAPELHRARYKIADIALDPFPYSGTTTTYEALYMGVPVVTLVGERHVQRTTYSFLKNLDIDSCIAFNENEYLDKAVNLATHDDFRSSVRDEIQRKFSDPRFGSPAYTKELEQTYLFIWNKYQRKHPPTEINLNIEK